MKIAVAASAPDLDGKVERKLGFCSHLLVVDTETGDFEAVPVPAGYGGGVGTVALAVEKGVETVLAGYASPHVVRALRESGVEIVTGVSGTAGEAIEKYRRGEVGPKRGGDRRLAGSLKQSARQFSSMLPVLVGVIMLVGLFKTFVAQDVLFCIFPGRPLPDTILGACLGSILAGNPVSSYVIGQSLLETGVSLFAVTAIVVTWVTVGLVQLPAEVSALGARFALSRTAAAFALSVPIAFLTALVVEFLA